MGKGSHRAGSYLRDENVEVGKPSGLTPAREADIVTEESIHNAQYPSSRCANREEWRGTCVSWSGKPHNRYLEVREIPPIEGIGANLMRVAWALNRAMSLDLEPVFIGPFLAAHGVGDFGEWFGLTSNTTLATCDGDGFRAARRQDVPFPEGNDDSWFRERINATSVIYVPDMSRVKKIVDWGAPVSPPPSDPGVCLYVRQVLRDLFWSAPIRRDRCGSMLPQEDDFPPSVKANRTTDEPSVRWNIDYDQPQRGTRPWVIAVHVRRGDMIRFRGGIRSIPHTYFVEAVRSVLRAIFETDNEARVSIFVFSEGPRNMPKQQLYDENGTGVTWDIPNGSCRDIGLRCVQVRSGFDGICIY